MHRAVTADGVDVACKLQYPDMLSAVDADLSQLKIVLGMFEKYDRSIGTGDVFKEVSDRLREELDYKREAQSTKLYAHMLGNESA
ncbi:MAG: AarF/UbiB family protein, partial [Leadbetterella sp.]|nr:AarF/UbiB family protein [Leadbetterella sp.]